MYKMIIVDDDRHVLNGYERKINWTELGVEIAGTASDGKEALALIEALRPSIVMTDIRMPIMDGIELIRAISDKELGCKVIIQSGYDEFEFAKQAIKYNAVDYLLKPTSVTEVKQIISTVVNELDEEEASNKSKARGQQAIYRTQLLECIIRKQPIDTLKELLRQQDFILDKGDYLLCGLVYDSKKQITDDTIDRIASGIKDCRVLIQRWDEYHWLYITILKGAESFKPAHKKAIWLAVAIKEGFYREHCLSGTRIVLGGMTEHIAGVYGSIDSAFELLNYRALISEDRVIDFMDNSPAEYEMLLNCQQQLEKAIYKRSSNISEALDAYFHVLHQLSTFSKDLYDMVMNFNYKWILMLKQYPHADQVLDNEFDIWDRLKRQNDIDSLKSYCVELVNLALQGVKEYEANTYSSNVQYVVSYVEKNFAEQILIKDLAKALFLSENYLTALFKKEIGITFKKYLTSVRIKNAKALLSDPKLKVGQISDMTGYNNYDYFCKVFREVTGMSPTEYRTTITYKVNR